MNINEEDENEDVYIKCEIDEKFDIKQEDLFDGHDMSDLVPSALEHLLMTERPHHDPFDLDSFDQPPTPPEVDLREADFAVPSTQPKSYRNVHGKIVQRRPQNLYRCIHCGLKTAWRFMMKNHFRRRHMGMKPFECDQCPFTTTSISHMYEHKRKHPRRRRKPEPPPPSLRTVTEHTSEKVFRCKSCKYKTTETQYLALHMGVHERRPLRVFRCMVCGFLTDKRHVLKGHKGTVHQGGRKFECRFRKTCRFKTTCATRLNMHNLVHTKKKRFECDVCNYRTTSEGGAKYHLVKHPLREAPAEDPQIETKWLVKQ